MTYTLINKELTYYIKYLGIRQVSTRICNNYLIKLANAYNSQSANNAA